MKNIEVKAKVELEAIIPEDRQIDALYKLLGERQHFISHRSLPAYQSHCDFVNNHPYREWFLIRMDARYVGSIYIGTDNSIGLNNLESVDENMFDEIVNTVLKNFEPLSPIPSVRPDSFYFNIATTNQGLMRKLEKNGYQQVQVTYSNPK